MALLFLMRDLAKDQAYPDFAGWLGADAPAVWKSVGDLAASAEHQLLVNADVLNDGGQIAAAIAAKVQVQGSGQSATADLGEIPGFFVP